MKVTEHNVDADWKVEELDALMELADIIQNAAEKLKP